MRKHATVEWDERQTPGANARARLPALVAEYFAKGRKAASPETAADDLHRFRLRTKRLRYTLELFRPCYGPGLDGRLRSLQEIQSLLGKLNDGQTALKLIAELLPARSAQRAKLERALKQAAAGQTAGFLSYWRETFDKPGEEEAWTQYLARNTRNSHAQPARKRRRPHLRRAAR